MKPELILCACHNPEHQIVHEDDSDDTYKMCYLTVHLNKLSFLGRLVYAWSYILGRRSKSGAFEELILEEDQMRQVIDYFNTILGKK